MASAASQSRLGSRFVPTPVSYERSFRAGVTRLVPQGGLDTERFCLSALAGSTRPLPLPTEICGYLLRSGLVALCGRYFPSLDLIRRFQIAVMKHWHKGIVVKDYLSCAVCCLGKISGMYTCNDNKMGSVRIASVWVVEYGPRSGMMFGMFFRYAVRCSDLSSKKMIIWAQDLSQKYVDLFRRSNHQS